MPPIKSLPNPIKELINIINSEVPTACFMGKLAKNNKAGIIKNPPPAPKNPIINPIKNPIIASIKKLISFASLIFLIF